MAKQYDGLILTPLEKSNVQPKFQRAEQENMKYVKLRSPYICLKLVNTRIMDLLSRTNNGELHK